ncbi:MAG: DUF4266 domain-containing protein [Calditrichaeota bacterium]|nr:DUF4266 domain-containing protein [Calditrichota bacterium]MCB0297884.1 DUF4266 domain-containing protein [Calditrichota bacterium]MCB0304303.1 DUF4266 domain-containing protein [Calditrichota bacterium]MCB0315431.1 DUF4266 domain-containing protein [Calditrichota bacterium]MCB9088272.1 DUF4266 domain-containing protein [Calditrichia bacterium]
MQKILLLLMTLLLLLSGCAAVQPWERETLSDPIMIFDENPIDSGIKEHYLDYREGSSGGTGAQSGGCGCG